jgi:hypothetical protein
MGRHVQRHRGWREWRTVQFQQYNLGDVGRDRFERRAGILFTKGRLNFVSPEDILYTQHPDFPLPLWVGAYLLDSCCCGFGTDKSVFDV